MQLSAVLASPFVLPSIPRVVALLLSELEREEADLKKITQLISQDPALTIRLMQLSNSGYFRMSGRVNSVSECLAIVGLSHVRTMTNASATKASLRAVVGINLQQYWSYSLDVAKVSRSLAGVVRQNQQAAFTAGMIHYVGEIVLRLLMPTEMARLDSDLPRDGAGTAPPAERKPISISNVREQRAKQQKRSMPRRNLPIEPATLLFGGAGIMVGGLILSMFYSPLLWLAFAGVVLFIAAFVWSIFRQAPERPVSGGPPRQGGKVFWRDRYIDVTPDASVGSKLMRRVRRK